jgi:hypothetical protein
LEIAVNRMRKVGASHKTAEALNILAPVGHQLGLAQQVTREGLAIGLFHQLRLLCKADEHGHCSSDPFDGFGAAVYFFNVDPWGKILGHADLLLYCN